MQQLETLPFFTGLPPTTLNSLVQEAIWREYDTGEIIFLEGEQATGLYYLQSGWVKAVKSSPVGPRAGAKFFGRRRHV